MLVFLLLEGENLATFIKGCRKVFSKACISGSTFYSCISQFRDGRTRVRDKSRPGRPAEAVTSTMVENVEVLVNKDHSMTL